jgi:hypothetical protein
MDIMVNYRHPDLLFECTGKRMKLDVWIPSKQLAFEYHGEHHFAKMNIFTPFEIVQQHNNEKRRVSLYLHISTDLH